MPLLLPRNRVTNELRKKKRRSQKKSYHSDIEISIDPRMHRLCQQNITINTNHTRKMGHCRQHRSLYDISRLLAVLRSSFRKSTQSRQKSLRQK